jgi:hypothetical protein
VERDLAGPAPADPLEDSVEAKPYLASQRLFDAPMDWGQRFSMKSAFLASLPEALVHEWADHVSRVPDGAEGGFSVWAWGRAIAAVAEEHTAFTGRDAAFWAGAEIAWNDGRSTTTAVPGLGRLPTRLRRTHPWGGTSTTSPRSEATSRA